MGIDRQSSIINRQSSIIRVLVVEDTPVVQEFLVHILNSDPEIQVIGTANNGEEAVEAVKQKKPDVITMDINMPKMNGLNATRKIMETYPTPIVIVSGSWDTKEVETTFRAIEAGALACIQRPAGVGHPDHEATAKELVQTVKLMSEVKVVKRWPHYRKIAAAPVIPAQAIVDIERIPSETKIVAIGASTGGPPVLHTILSGLSKDFSVPILIVQHMAKGFTKGLVEWLAQSTGFPVHVAVDGEYLLPGHAYIAPNGLHMKVIAGNRIALSKDEPEEGLRPSASYLFRSVSNVFGKNAVGILLTGMGKDGAEELKLMKEKGAVTIAQNKESSVIFGMPGEAVKLDGTTYVLSPDNIVEALKSLTKKNIVEVERLKI
jgi:two-component system chemotaxis response regulator CheB